MEKERVTVELGEREEEVEEGVRVGEGCRRTWVRLRERKRSLSVSWTDGADPRLSLEWERLAGGFFSRGEPDREPGPEPGLEPLTRVKL